MFKKGYIPRNKNKKSLPKIIIICMTCKKIKAKQIVIPKYTYWHHFGSKWMCPQCYNKDIRIKEVLKMSNKEVVCKICNITEKLNYYDNKIPIYDELSDKGWHHFGPKWICCKCYDKHIRVIPTPLEIHTHDY